MASILIAEDDPVQQRMIQMLLSKRMGHQVTVAGNGREAIEIMKSSALSAFQLVLLDINMPVMDGFETLKYLRKYRPDLPVIMLTGQDDTSVAVQAIKDGATDFVVKPAEPDHLAIIINNAVRMQSMSAELSRLKRDREGALGFEDLIGHSGGLAEAVAFGRKAAQSDVPVYIEGETGSGKELFARAIHGESRRVGAPFVAINCGAIPKQLIESILFGHEKGSFSGATQKTLGKFREAEGGTIFLDEIGELPLDAQVKLLRVLQEKEVEPVGGGANVKVNVRIISATNRNLKAMVADGSFREDLFFRLHVLPIHLPPLRKRSEDIEALAKFFITRFAVQDMVAEKRLSASALEFLYTAPWSGNVRELENLMRRSLVLCDSEVIEAEDLKRLQEGFSPALNVLEPSNIPKELRLNLMQQNQLKTMEQIEAEVMTMALEHYDHNITKASDALGIAKSTFYRKIKDAKSS